jgi:hypothetical protein
VPEARPEAQPDTPRTDIGDLFDHFGVAREQRGAPGPIITAEACAVCGWLCPVDVARIPCPVCGSDPTDSTPST